MAKELRAKIRAFEEQVNELYKSAKMPDLVHLDVGQDQDVYA